MADPKKILGGLGKVSKRLLADADDAALAQRAQATNDALAKLDAGKKLSKAENITAGLYHPIGEGKKLNVPFSRMTSTTVDNPNVTMHQGRIITPEQAVKDRMGFFPLIGDRAETGKILTHVNNRKAKYETPLTGGGKYGQANYDPVMAKSSAWESGANKVGTLRNRITDIAGSGYQPVGVFSPGSHVQVDFNTMMPHALLGQFDQADTTKKLVKQFDKEVKSIYPDWVGITSPEAEAQLMEKTNGGLRTVFTKTMGKDDYQAGGFPDVPSVRKAISDPDLFDTELGTLGQNMAVFDPTGALVAAPKNPSSYPLSMSAQNIGKMDKTEKFSDFFTTANERRRLLSSDPAKDYRSFELSQPIQYADEEWLNKLMETRRLRDEAIKKGGYAKGGSVDIKAADARLAAAMGQRMAKGGSVDIEAADARLEAAMAQCMAQGGEAGLKKLEFMAEGGSPMQAGGAAKGAAKGFKKLFADRDVLSLVEREANKAKFLESSAEKGRFYHGTDLDFNSFRSSRNGTFLSPEPKFASDFALENATLSPRVIPVRVQVKNPFDYQNKEHMRKLRELAEKRFPGSNQNVQRELEAIAYKNDYGNVDSNWSHMENDDIQKLIKQAGHDAFYVSEDGIKNLSVFNPKAIKSDIGNRGTYDLDEADIGKAGGGVVDINPRVHDILNAAPIRMGVGGLLKGAIKGGTRKFGEDAKGLSVIKEPGGNWIGGSVEEALKPLRKTTAGGLDPVDAIEKLKKQVPDNSANPALPQRPANVTGHIQRLEQDAALNNWVDRNLGNYVKKQMGTKDDPVRKLAEEGITHMPKDAINRGQWLSENMENIRRSQGFPGAGMGNSETARGWENLVDEAIQVTAPNVQTREALAANPWLSKLPPNQSVYRASKADMSELNFDHIMDVLRMDIAAGRIRPEQLNKISMEQAVRRTAEYDQEMAKKMRETQIKNTAGMPTHKDYPDKGYKWIELKQPEGLPKDWTQDASGAYISPTGERTIVNPSRQMLDDALKYEGDTMGHCVGSYCDDVVEGNSRIYSLRDRKGEPHVTVQVESNTKPYPVSGESFAKLTGAEKAQYREHVMQFRRRNPDIEELTDEHTAQALREAGVLPQPDRIVQIKGKGNAAPKDDYLPFVQDFVRGGKWSDVGDSHNAGLRRYGDVFNVNEQRLIEQAGELVPNHEYLSGEEIQRLHNAITPEGNRLKYNFKGNISDDGMAKGGGAFKTLQFNEPQHFDGGGIASPEESSGYSPESFFDSKRYGDIKKNAAEMFDETKKSLASDYDRLKNSSRARAQLAKIAAAQLAGTAPDIASLVTPLVNSDAVLSAFPMARAAKIGLTGTSSTGRRTSVLSDEQTPYSLADLTNNAEGNPIGGSEDIIKRSQKAGLMHTGRFSPLTEIGTSVLGGLGASKVVRGAVNAGERFGKGFDKGYARAMSKQEPPFLNELGYDSVLDKQPVKMLGQQPQVMTALPGTPQGATYATKQEGPFYRVSPTSLDVSGAKNRGIREAPELQGEGLDLRATGQTGREVPQLLSPEEVGRIIADPAANQPLQIAQRFTKETQGTDFARPDIPESSLAKQSAIGRAQQLAVEGSPEYKTAVFDAYAKQMPDLLEQVGAKNYDDLMEKAYRQLAKETDDQFKALPYNFSYHRAGEGNYNGAIDMASDVHGNKHLYVYQGGDPHDFLNRMDKASGLNENEKFRAVHDLLGHAIYGNQFGPKGEEIAWAVHQQMYSPLARLAMTAETRGQNSMVNYSPLNVKVKSAIAKLDELEVQALRKGDKALVNEIRAAKRQEYAGFEFAPNKAVLLPPEFVDPKFTGGMPDYLSAANRPAKGTETQSVLTHFSNDPNLQMLDPKRYGTGIKGAEAERLNDFAGGVKDRSYVYLGEPGTIAPESGLGVNRYRGESSNLYDITKDPLQFRALARESNRTPFTAKVNAGITSPLQEANDYERLVKEYGYEGMINPNASKPMGIMFNPTPVQPRKRGGLTQLRAR